MSATAGEEEEVEIVSIYPLGFTGICREMDPFRDNPAAAPDPENQKIPVRFPFCLDRENILEKCRRISSLTLLIDLDLKIADLRVRGAEDTILIESRYFHQRDIDDGSDINKVGMAHMIPAIPPGFVRYNTCHAILSYKSDGPVAGP